MNFGDEVTPLLIRKLFGYRVEWSPPEHCDIAGAGSIMEILQRESKNNCVQVWGSGFIKTGDDDVSNNLNFLAIRGRYSQARLNHKVKVLGDPGLLISRAYKPKSSKQRYRVGIIPHYVDTDSVKFIDIQSRLNAKIINVLDSPEKVADSIAACDIILSSSLHGLVFSDSYGKPSIWTPFSEKLVGGDYKFNDYYSIFGEEAKKIDCKTVTSAMIDEFIKNYQPRAVVNIQNELMKSFPF